MEDLAPGLPEGDLEWVRKQIEACLSGRGGEVSARRRAAEPGHSYGSSSEAGRERFLRLLASDYGIDQDAIRRLAAAVVEAEEGEALDAAEDGLRRALVAPRVRRRCAGGSARPPVPNPRLRSRRGLQFALEGSGRLPASPDVLMFTRPRKWHTCTGFCVICRSTTRTKG